MLVAAELTLAGMPALRAPGLRRGAFGLGAARASHVYHPPTYYEALLAYLYRVGPLWREAGCLFYRRIERFRRKLMVAEIRFLQAVDLHKHRTEIAHDALRPSLAFSPSIRDRTSGRDNHLHAELGPSASCLGALSRQLPYAVYPPDGGGGISASGDTGNVPVCCAKWWDRRREIASPVMSASPTAITPTDTTPAISNSIHSVSGALLASRPLVRALSR
jgi:hypothetical protein